MIHLFHGGGASDIRMLRRTFPAPEWEQLKSIVVRRLEDQRDCEAAGLLAKYPFALYDAVNGFGDEFKVLYLQVSPATYIELAAMADDPDTKVQFAAIAATVTKVSSFVRFVSVETDSRQEPVPSPVLAITSEVVDRALRDAECLLVTEGATSGVDRVHTALHGYLRAVVNGAGLSSSENAGITELFRTIRTQHPRFQQTGPRQGDIERITRALSTIVDTMNPVRNQASVAHPNETLLEEPEAMLVINSARSMLQYIDARLRK